MCLGRLPGLSCWFALAVCLSAPPVLCAQVRINEFVALNDTGLLDEDGDASDWLEVHNSGAAAVDLNGWYLTDDDADPWKWRFPAVSVPAGGFLVIFASDKNRTSPGAELHTNFKLSGAGEYLALLRADGTTIVHEFAPQFPQQYVDTAYGHDGAGYSHLMTPTPGQPNSGPWVPPPVITPDSRFFTGQLTVSMQALPGVTIRYTLDGTEPTPETGLVYDAPLALTSSQTLKAIAYASETARSWTIARRYVLLTADVADFSSNLPLIVADTHGEDVTTDAYTPSLVSVIETSGGRTVLTDPPQWCGSAGLELRGSTSLQFPKKQFKLETWDESRDDLDVALLGLPADSDWVLYGPYSDKTLLRNVLAYQWSNEIGRYAPRTRFVELFLHTTEDDLSAANYHGVYVLIEKITRGPHRVDITALTPADNAEPEISGGYMLKIDRADPGDIGFTTDQGVWLLYVDPKEGEVTAPQTAWILDYMNDFETALYGEDFADPELGYARYIDVDAFIDHHLIVEMLRNIDGYRLSTYMYKDRGGALTMGPVWDYNLSLGNADYLSGYRTTGWYYTIVAGTSAAWYRRMQQDPEWFLRRSDRWFALREDEFDTGRLLAQIDAWTVTLDEAQTRNFVRWPILGVDVWPNYFIGQTYQEEIDWMKGWLSERLAWIDTQLRPPPVFNQDGGRVAAGFELTMTAAGTVYYTIDGSDPRLRGGAVNPTAFVFDGTPVPLYTSTLIKARAQVDGKWTALNAASFQIDVLPVVMSEIMYQPPGGDAEFVELYNPSPTHAVDLSGWRLAGCALTFPEGTSLGPGAYALVVRDAAAFAAAYGPGYPVVAEYHGALENDGEQLALFTSDDVLVDTVRYESVPPWPSGPAGLGSSLELIDAEQDNDRRANWAASLVPGGTPGAANSVAGPRVPLPDLWLNEALALNATVSVDEQGEAEPWFEIHNHFGEPVALGGLTLTNNLDLPDLWTIPAGVTVPPRGWRVFWADNEPGDGPTHVNFTLSPAGGTLGLFTPAGELIDYLRYGALAPDASHGKFPDGPALARDLAWATPGAANVARRVPLILNEYNAVRADNYLESPGSDVFWGRVLGNGGPWFELVVTEDRVDLRGWQLDWLDEDGGGTLTLTFDPLWAGLRAGTIITVGANLPDQVSYAPGQGDWWIHVQAAAGGTGTYISAQDFRVSNDAWRLTIRDAAGHVVFGPAGEGVHPASGIGSDEVFKLEEDPTPYITEYADYNDGSSSTFGAPNRYAGGTEVQDFSLLRDAFAPCATDGDCDDGNPCTIDTCDEWGGCVHTPVADGAPCADGEFCNGDELCLDGVCVAGEPPCVSLAYCDEVNDVCLPCLQDGDCDDGNPCTVDTCVDNQCVHIPVVDGTPCPDGDVCNGDEICYAGVCASGTPLNCDDGNPCTTDLCDPVAGCTWVPVANGTPCSDGLFCNGEELCVDGFCADGPPPCTDPCEKCDEDADACVWCRFDLDRNGFIGSGDLAIFAGCYGASYTPGEPCALCNFDGSLDGFVGPGDVALLAGCFGKACAECTTGWGEGLTRPFERSQPYDAAPPHPTRRE